MLKPYFHLHLTCLFRQLDKDDGNDDENDIDIFPGQTNIGHIKYHKQNNFFTISRSEFSEFKGDVTKMLEKHEVKLRRVTTKYKHTHTAFIEALNKVQDAQELNDPEKVSAAWVKHLYGLVDELNDTTTEMVGMKPSDAIKLDEVPLVKEENYPPEDKLPEDGLYQYLLQPSEKHRGQRRRARDRIWSKKTYRLREIVENSGNPVMYYLSEGPERSFVSEELMLIPEDTELLPDYVQN